jgi:hypothetical protein
MITGILMNSIIELPCKPMANVRSVPSILKVIYDIVIKPLLPYICDQCMGS